MKIIFDHQIFCLQKYGGISRYVAEIASNISQATGHNSLIYAPFYVNEYLSAVSGSRTRGIKVPRLFGYGRWLALAIDTVLAYLVIKPRRNVDIFHETYFSTFDCCPSSAKRVITVYDMTYEIFSDISQRKKLQKIKSDAIKRADHIICISENTRKDVIRLLDIPIEKTSVVHLGYSLFANKKIKDPVETGKPFILFVGMRDRYKNFSALLNAYANSDLLKNKYNIIGFGGGGLTESELLEIENHQLSSTCVQIVPGDDNVLAWLYSNAAVFVYPSLYEGFGIPPLEAMSFDCPVVCSNTSSLPEVVGDAAKLFDPTDEQALQVAIESVVTQPEYAGKLIEKGRERIKHFSWEKCARETLDVYKKILESNQI